MTLRRALLLSLLALGCSKKSAPNPFVTFGTGDLRVTMDPAKGTYDVTRAGQLVFEHATADVLFDAGAGAEPADFTTCLNHTRGDGDAFVCTAGGLELSLTLRVPEGKQFATAQLKATNRSEAMITVLRLAPLVADSSHGGALWLGADPDRHRVLENGQYLVMDQAAQLKVPTSPPVSLAEALPIPLRGNSVSNWNHLVKDLDSSRALVAGYLSFDHAIPTLGIAPSDRVGTDGRKAFSFFAESALIFRGKPLQPGQSIESEVLYLEPLPADPLEAVERYASELAEYKRITPWTKRGADHVVPDGWNSWSGGDGTGGHGHDIDEPLIKTSLDIYAKEFIPFGARYFQIDDGWEEGIGDWQWRTDAFPSGGAGMASAIAAKGLKPGVWEAMFSVDPSSAVGQAHPDWLQPREDGIIGLFGKDRGTLDLTNPAVRDHVKQSCVDLRDAGFKWVKVDFSYFTVLGKPQYDPTYTNIEAWAAGWQIIRDTLGPDVFVEGIGIMGTNIGRVDGMRLTNDDGPRWEDPSPDDALESSRSFKESVRVGARRWFYQNRVWMNHDDLIYFRSDKDPQYERLTFNESRTFASWIGLGGGMVDIGDKLVDMAGHPEQTDVVRRLLPVWPDGARPLDVLVRDFPEQYRQRIDSRAGKWENVGLFNWGRNRDWNTNPPTTMNEETRTYTVICVDCLAYEFWSEEFLGHVTKKMDVSVAPRDSKVIALRPVTGAPQFLGSNRHITQGANDMGPVLWDATTKTLSGTLIGAVGTDSTPFTYHLAFYVPKDFTFDQAQVSGADVQAVQEGHVARLQFALAPEAQGREIAFSLTFR